MFGVAWIRRAQLELDFMRGGVGKVYEPLAKLRDCFRIAVGLAP